MNHTKQLDYYRLFISVKVEELADAITELDEGTCEKLLEQLKRMDYLRQI